jgi:hypothetical protein
MYKRQNIDDYGNRVCDTCGRIEADCVCDAPITAVCIGHSPTCECATCVDARCVKRDAALIAFERLAAAFGIAVQPSPTWGVLALITQLRIAHAQGTQPLVDTLATQLRSQWHQLIDTNVTLADDIALAFHACGIELLPETAARARGLRDSERATAQRKAELDRLAAFAASHSHEVETDYANDCIRVGIQWINSSQGTRGVEWSAARNLAALRDLLGY